MGLEMDERTANEQDGMRLEKKKRGWERADERVGGRRRCVRLWMRMMFQ